MSKVILYDIPSKEPTKCWSLNPWKPRLVLNYKGIEYKTEWVEYPDLEPTFKALGLEPNDRNAKDFFADYTSPAVRFEDGTIMMESWNIAHELEKRYPTPSLGLDEPIVTQVKEFLPKMLGPLRPNVMPLIPRNLLTPKSAEYFERTRAVRFGMPLSQLEAEKGGEQCWEEVKGPVKEAGDLLRKHGGPFFLGERVTYADFIVVGLLEFLRRIDVALLERYLSLDPALGKLYEASAEWLKRAD